MEKRTKRRRGLGLAAGLFLAVGLLAGCGGVKAEDLMKEASENASKASSVKGSMDMDMKMGVKQSGISVSLDLGMDMDIEAVNDPAQMHMKGKMTMSLMNISADMELYMALSEDGKKLTTYVKAADQWTVQESEMDENAADSLDVMDFSAYIEEAGDFKLQKGTEEVNGKEVYVIKSTVDGNAIAAAEKLLGDAMEQMKGIDYSKLKVDCTFKIFKDTKLPASISMEIKEGMGIQMDVQGAEASLDGMSFTINYDEYNTVDSIQIPKEALDEAKESNNTSGGNSFGKPNAGNTDETEPAESADGVYTIQDYDDSRKFSVKCPEGMEHNDYTSEYTAYFSADTDNGFYSAAYSAEKLSEYNSEQDIIDYFKEDQEYYGEDEDYSDIVYEDVKAFAADGKEIKYISLSYRFMEDTYYRDWQAWFVTEDGYAMVCNITEYSAEGPVSMVDEEMIGRLLSCFVGDDGNGGIA